MPSILKQSAVDIAKAFDRFSLWRGGGGETLPTIFNIEDVRKSEPLNNKDVLTFNGTNWTNMPLNIGGIKRVYHSTEGRGQGEIIVDNDNYVGFIISAVFNPPNNTDAVSVFIPTPSTGPNVGVLEYVQLTSSNIRYNHRKVSARLYLGSAIQFIIDLTHRGTQGTSAEVTSDTQLKIHDIYGVYAGSGSGAGCSVSYESNVSSGIELGNIVTGTGSFPIISGLTFSKTPITIGKWWDGKDIKLVCVDITERDTDLSNYNIDTMIDYFLSNKSGYYTPTNYYSSSSDRQMTYYNHTNKTFRNTQTGWSYNATLTIIYTEA